MLTEWVYLIHMDRPVSPDHTAQHYLGSAIDPYERLEEHKAGHGARLLQVANERGIDYGIVRLWEGDRKLERQLKSRKEAPKLCPVCAEERKRQAGQLGLMDDFSLDDVEELEF